jgi:hypothetical protein
MNITGTLPSTESLMLYYESLPQSFHVKTNTAKQTIFSGFGIIGSKLLKKRFGEIKTNFVITFS